MSLYNSFKTNDKKENKGVAVTYAPNDDKTVPTFWVARQAKSNKKYRKVIKELYKPYRREIQLGIMKDEVAEELSKLGFIKGCLIRWENVQDLSGKELPFSEENAKILFSDLPELMEDLMERSTDLSNYQDEQLEEEAKN